MEGPAMRLLRHRISRRLLEAGATLALERQQMLRRCEHRDPGRFDRCDAQVLYVSDTLDLLSSAAIRLGVVVMPDDSIVPR